MTSKTSKKRSTLKKISRAESASTQLVGCVVTAQLRADAAWDALKWGVDDEDAGARWLSAERDLDACKDATTAIKTGTLKKISRAVSDITTKEVHALRRYAVGQAQGDLISLCDRALAGEVDAWWLVRMMAHEAQQSDTYCDVKNMAAK